MHAGLCARLDLLLNLGLESLLRLGLGSRPGTSGTFKGPADLPHLRGHGSGQHRENCEDEQMRMVSGTGHGLHSFAFMNRTERCCGGQ